MHMGIDQAGEHSTAGGIYRLGRRKSPAQLGCGTYPYNHGSVYGDRTICTISHTLALHREQVGMDQQLIYLLHYSPPGDEKTGLVIGDQPGRCQGNW
jgi:hypothetical protein